MSYIYMCIMYTKCVYVYFLIAIIKKYGVSCMIPEIHENTNKTSSLR